MQPTMPQSVRISNTKGIWRPTKVSLFQYNIPAMMLLHNSFCIGFTTVVISMRRNVFLGWLGGWGWGLNSWLKPCWSFSSAPSSRKQLKKPTRVHFSRDVLTSVTASWLDPETSTDSNERTHVKISRFIAGKHLEKYCCFFTPGSRMLDKVTAKLQTKLRCLLHFT